MLGAVLFECVTGRPAFVARHMMALFEKICIEPSPRARSVNPAVPEELDDLLFRMLAKERAARPAGATAVRQELSRLRDGLI